MKPLAGVLISPVHHGLRDAPSYVDKPNNCCHKTYMPRRSRIDASRALHYIIVRGIDRKVILSPFRLNTFTIFLHLYFIASSSKDAFFKVPAMVCVNKFDLNSELTGSIKNFSREKKWDWVTSCRTGGRGLKRQAINSNKWLKGWSYIFCFIKVERP